MKSIHFLSTLCCDLVDISSCHSPPQGRLPIFPQSGYLEITWPYFGYTSSSFSLDTVNLQSIYSKDPSVQLSLLLLLSLQMAEEVIVKSTVTLIFRG